MRKYVFISKTSEHINGNSNMRPLVISKVQSYYAVT